MDIETPVQQGGNPARLLKAISDIDGRQYTVESARLFTAALNPMSLKDALNAFAQWQRKPHAYSRIQPYDINEIVKSWRQQRIPSEYELSREIAAAKKGLTAAQYLAYLRARVSGKSVDESRRIVAGIPQQIEHHQSKKHVNNRAIARQMARAGSIPVSDIISK